MRGQLFLCSHRYQFVDAIQIMKYLWNNANLLKSNNLVAVTSSQSVNVESAQLFIKLIYGLNLSIIVSKRDNMSAANQIQTHLENGDSVFIFYEKHRASAGIWHILNNLQHNVEIHIVRIVIQNAPITTWIPDDVIANLMNDIRVMSYYFTNMGYITQKDETVKIEQLPDRIFAAVDADEFKIQLRQLLYSSI
jgi:hypothetical protein